MNDALNIYEAEERIACVCGYLYPVKAILPNYFFLRIADSWGWATWKRAWDYFESDGQKLLTEIQKRHLSSQFNCNNTYNYTGMLKQQMAGIISSWAIRWYASIFLRNQLCLYPGKSYVKNIGSDGSGVHSGKENQFDTELAESYIEITPMSIEESLIARRAFEAYFRHYYNLFAKIIRAIKNGTLGKKVKKIIRLKFYSYNWEQHVYSCKKSL
jgi:hypothetical protein